MSGQTVAIAPNIPAKRILLPIKNERFAKSCEVKIIPA
jgi:hypothetical protein